MCYTKKDADRYFSSFIPERSLHMFRLWGKIIKDNHLLKDMTVSNDTEDTRTHKIFSPWRLSATLGTLDRVFGWIPPSRNSVGTTRPVFTRTALLTPLISIIWKFRSWKNKTFPGRRECPVTSRMDACLALPFFILCIFSRPGSISLHPEKISDFPPASVPEAVWLPGRPTQCGA